MYSSHVAAFLQNYQRTLDLISYIILSTDLAHHLRIMEELKKMSQGMTSVQPNSLAGSPLRQLTYCRNSGIN